MPQRKRIKLETSPHAIELEGLPGMPDVVELLFQPEVLSDEYLQRFADYQDRVEATGLDPDAEDGAGDPRLDGDTRSAVAELEDATRDFLAGFMLEPSRELFLGREDPPEPPKPAKATRAAKAAKAAKQVKAGDAAGATATAVAALATDPGVMPYKMRLPQWVLSNMVQQVVEFYSDRPTGSSNVSAQPPSRAGRRSTGQSPSRPGRTRGRGR